MPTLIGVRRLPRILLVEPDGLVRGTVVSVCRDLQLADVVQAGSSDLAMKLLLDDSLQAGILSLSDGGSGLDLLTRLREGAFTCPSDMPVAMTAAGIDAATAGRLKELRIRRLLLKPFKIRDLVATVETLLVAATVPG
jgi:DNA-binding response OmpR family regulator